LSGSPNISASSLLVIPILIPLGNMILEELISSMGNTVSYIYGATAEDYAIKDADNAG